MSETKTCKNCGEAKNITEFYRTDAVRGYYRCNCKVCDREYVRNYYHSHPEYAERVRRSVKENRTKTQEEKEAAVVSRLERALGNYRTPRERAKENQKRFMERHPDYYQKRRAYILQWHKDNPMPRDRKARNEMRSVYGIGPEDYKRMLEVQNHKCALCGSDDSGRKSRAWKWGLGYLSIDHCHTTGRVRGLLCHWCNTRLGAYEKLAEKVGLDKVKAYLSDPPELPPLHEAAK